MAKYIITGGPHYKRGFDGKWKRYVKDDTIDLSDLHAQSIMDKLKRVSPKEPIEQDIPEKKEKQYVSDTQESPDKPEENRGLKAVHKGAGRYDVVNEKSGKKLNEKSLSKDEANALLDNS